MLQNIKVDLIYFATPTDFEMEFNLGGCCRMRLLADKAADRKGFIHLLSRAVSRSRVIICCGALFGEGGLIAGIAAAIGRPLTSADNEPFGIQANQKIDIIEGSMPLVTEDGVFGGCVIESGPQSIILLTESKSVRKTLMNSLIHPYIEGLSRKNELEQGAAEQPEAPVEAPAETSTETPIEPVVIPTKSEETVIPEISETEESEVEPEEDGVIAEEPGAEISPDEEIVKAEETVETEEAVEETAEAEVFSDWIIDIGEKAPVEASAEEKNEEPIEESDEEPVEEPVEEPDEDTQESESAEESEAEPNEDMEAEEPKKAASTPLIDPADMELFIDPQDVVFNHKKYYEMYYEAEENLVGGIGETDELHKSRLPLPILILIIVLAICLVFLGIWLVALPLLRGVSIAQNFSNLFGASVITGRLL